MSAEQPGLQPEQPTHMETVERDLVPAGEVAGNLATAAVVEQVAGARTGHANDAAIEAARERGSWWAQPATPYEIERHRPRTAAERDRLDKVAADSHAFAVANGYRTSDGRGASGQLAA